LNQLKNRIIRLFVVILLLLINSNTRAQFRYSFKDTSATYVPLIGGTSLNGTTIWDEQKYVAPMPFSWTMDSSFTLNSLKLKLSGYPGIVVDTAATNNVNGFFFGDFDIADRGLLSGTASYSPIRYLTAGTAPNRIFKVELSNAGFWNEPDLYLTMNDYFNWQIWIYEGSQIVEFHYGPSQITYPKDYYYSQNTGPLCGYAKHVNEYSGFPSTGTYYFLKDITTPKIDTDYLPTLPSISLSSWPANGRVFRFVPKWKLCVPPLVGFSASPVGKIVSYTYSGTPAIDSIRWDFGDGGTSTSLNPTHTFSSNGHYTVCVTAYNSCGSNTVCKPLALGVEPLDSWDQLRVYPEPIRSQLMIDGFPGTIQLEVLDMKGEVQYHQYNLRSPAMIDLQHLAAGIYLLRLEDHSGGRIYRRIIRI